MCKSCPRINLFNASEFQMNIMLYLPHRMVGKSVEWSLVSDVYRSFRDIERARRKRMTRHISRWSVDSEPETNRYQLSSVRSRNRKVNRQTWRGVSSAYRSTLTCAVTRRRQDDSVLIAIENPADGEAAHLLVSSFVCILFQFCVSVMSTCVRATERRNERMHIGSSWMNQKELSDETSRTIAVLS